MTTKLLKCVAVGAAILMGSNAAFAVAQAKNTWRYYAAKETGNPTNVACIVQDPWILSVNSWNASTGALQFGSPTILKGEGVLDLQNVQVQTADALVPIASFDFDRAGYMTNEVTELWVTHLKNIPTIQNNKYLRRIVYTSDLLTEMRWKAYAGCVNLTNFQARCPNLLLYRGEVFTNLLSFTIKWPNIHRMGSDLGGHFLGSACHLKDLCIYMPALTNLAGGEFGGISKLERLTMLGDALSPAVMDKITAALPTRAADSEDRRVIMYCSKKKGWKDFAAKLTKGTYEESAAPAGCFGVYTNSAGQRKAWMVHLPQKGDYGMCIRVQ